MFDTEAVRFGAVFGLKRKNNPERSPQRAHVAVKVDRARQPP
jgi:hypothetical protein